MPFLLALSLAAAAGYDYYLLGNLGTIVPEKVYRSGQPWNWQLEHWIQERGLKTILVLKPTLRSSEQRLADDRGVELIHVPFTIDEGLSEANWARILAILTDPARMPVLFHCHGGSNKAGLVTALYRTKIQGWPSWLAQAEMLRYYAHPTSLSLNLDGPPAEASAEPVSFPVAAAP